jgi:hypothetical protein
MSNREQTADAWALARAGGPILASPGEASPAGMMRLVDPDGGAVWLVPQVPDTADVRVLAELGLPAPTVEQPNDTARMLAACLRCCWDDPLGSPWPGTSSSTDRVLALFRKVAGSREEAAYQRAGTGALRRLDQTRWVLHDESGGSIRMGPRVVLWSTSDLTGLRQLWRSMPVPEARQPGSGEPRP